MSDDWNRELAQDLASMSRDPLRFVKYAYPWGRPGPLENEKGLRTWQAEELNAVKTHLTNPATRFQPFRSAVASGHGVGKSAFLSMLTGWAMSTCEDCKVVITANTEPQLRTKTWPEIGKWHRLMINSHWFDYGATSLTVKDKAHARTWRADTISWSENNVEAFSGLHNVGKRIVLIFDEASAISDRIWETAEGALTDESTEILWFVFGNPTLNSGRFRECFGSQGHRWRTRQIDSRTVEGTNKTELTEWEKTYGEDSDFFRVRCRGEFPRAGTSQFISSDVVSLCRKYKAVDYQLSPKIMSVDPARFGEDRTEIGMRQGRKITRLASLRGLDGPQVAERVIEFIRREDSKIVVVDSQGIGASVFDHLVLRGWSGHCIEFNGSVNADDWNMYFNRRSEVWGRLRDWLSAGGEIPDSPEVEADLTAPMYGFSNKGQIQLESKKDIKRRGLASPDFGDMAAMTFHVTLAELKPVPTEKRYVYPSAGGLRWMQ